MSLLICSGMAVGAEVSNGNYSIIVSWGANMLVLVVGVSDGISTGGWADNY